MNTERPHVMAGMALLGAGVIAATPIAPPPDVHIDSISSAAVRLAARSIANVPVNLIEDTANIPANEIKALQQLADALKTYGNIWQLNPVNVIGYDAGDPPEVAGLVNVLLPIPALSVPLGEQLNIILKAGFPMNAGCTALPSPCPDPVGTVSGWFRVPLWQLIAGYTFPTLTNPAYWPNGETDVVPWSGTTVYLEPLAPIRSLGDSLLAEPSGIEIVPPRQAVTTVADFAEGLNVVVNPYAPGSFALDPEKNALLASVLGALEPVLGRFAPDPLLAIPDQGGELPMTPVHTILIGGHAQQNRVQQNSVIDAMVGSLNDARDTPFPRSERQLKLGKRIIATGTDADSPKRMVKSVSERISSAAHRVRSASKATDGSKGFGFNTHGRHRK